MTRPLAIVLTVWLLAVGGPAFAADEPGYRVHTTDAKYEDVRDDLQNAIINRGFVVDQIGNLGAMLDRTADVVTDAVSGAAAPPAYKHAEYLQFCPLKLTHEAVRASPLAIANCPVSIFIFEEGAEPGKIHVGYRLPPATASRALQDVNEKLVALLDALAKEAVGK